MSPGRVAKPRQRVSVRPWRNGCWQLFAASVIIALVWGLVLPRLSRVAPIAERISRNHRAGIEADAMFYTELGPLRGVRWLRTPEGGRFERFAINR